MQGHDTPTRERTLAEHWEVASSQLFMPHRVCVERNPVILVPEVAGNLGFAVAYFWIPVTLWLFATLFRAHLGRPALWAARGFVVFIVLCGITHAVDVVTVYVGAYQLTAATKLVGGAFSIYFASRFWTLYKRVESDAAVRAAAERILDMIRGAGYVRR